MIRRDDGGDWLLIDQIQHARLAAEIARAWGNDRFKPLTRDIPAAVAARGDERPDEDWRLARLRFKLPCLATTTVGAAGTGIRAWTRGRVSPATFARCG